MKIKRALVTNRNVSGSRIVIYKHREHYIDVRTDRHSRLDIVECVRNGQVYRQVVVDASPAAVVQLIREELV